VEAAASSTMTLHMLIALTMPSATVSPGFHNTYYFCEDL
jgi:hypothetical protein